jgi:hypothetical protein
MVGHKEGKSTLAIFRQSLGAILILSGVLQVFTPMRLARAGFDQERGVTQKVHFDRDAFKTKQPIPVWQ